MVEAVNNSKLLDFQKRSILSKVMIIQVSTSFMPLEGLFSKKAITPSLRAHFITLIDVLISWNYQLINDNWNVGKIYAFFLPRKRETWPL